MLNLFPILIVFEILSVLIASIDHFDLVILRAYPNWKDGFYFANQKFVKDCQELMMIPFWPFLDVQMQLREAFKKTWKILQSGGADNILHFIKLCLKCILDHSEPFW